MKFKNYANLLLSILLVLALSACTSKEPTKQTVDSENHSSNVKKDNEKVNPSQEEKDFQYEIDGLSKLEKDVQKGDFESAGNLFEQLHEVYHPSVLPSVEKKNPELAEEMHNKFDALEDAINRKDKTQVLKMVHTNRQYLLKAGKELEFSLK